MIASDPDRRAVGSTQPPRTLDDRVENQLEVECRPAHRREHLVGCDDLLSGIREIASQEVILRRKIGPRIIVHHHSLRGCETPSAW